MDRRAVKSKEKIRNQSIKGRKKDRGGKSRIG